MKMQHAHYAGKTLSTQWGNFTCDAEGIVEVHKDAVEFFQGPLAFKTIDKKTKHAAPVIEPEPVTEPEDETDEIEASDEEASEDDASDEEVSEDDGEIESDLELPDDDDLIEEEKKTKAKTKAKKPASRFAGKGKKK